VSLLRLLNAQGIAGLCAALALAILLVIQKGETRHWKRQSGQFEQSFRAGQAAFATTVADYRAAAARAERDDLANKARVEAGQRAINERTVHDFEAHLADARARAGRLRVEAAAAAADPGAGASAPVPGLPAAPAAAADAAGKDRLPPADALVATEQAIQLDELIKWVKRQSATAGPPGRAAE